MIYLDCPQPGQAGTKKVLACPVNYNNPVQKKDSLFFASGGQGAAYAVRRESTGLAKAALID